MRRVIAYIDGYNLYYGLREKKWKWAYWLDLHALVSNLLKPKQLLITTKYFTTIVKYPLDRHRRQAVYLEALQTLESIEVYFGHFLSQTVVCQKCGASHLTHHEKMTDVNIAVEMMTDAFQNRMDVIILLSGDSDLVGSIHLIKQLFPEKRIIIAFPPARKSESLKGAADGYTHIGRDTLVHSLLPDVVIKPNGIALRRPARWR